MTAAGAAATVVSPAMTEIHSALEALILLDDKPMRLSPGQVLFREGDPSDGRMYLVREGTIELRAGRRKLEEVNPGGTVGEMALIDPAPRSATAVAATDCTVAAVGEYAFHGLVKRMPALALELMRLMVRRLRHTTALTALPRAAKARRPARPKKSKKKVAGRRKPAARR